VLSGRGLCDELITRPEESYRLCCVVVCDLETSRIGAPYIYDISNLRLHYDTGRIKFLLFSVKIQGEFLLALTLLNSNKTKSNCSLTYLY
jgi:hypothetical protein